ncbi:MAG: hypothetical protein IE933_15025 [Sphingomonadales bacterium]|nr:hypothetical protein [Sphingomonadales bacterium]MBD3773511.1 hypothetical protein [Paracoccaceae bacterium]
MKVPPLLLGACALACLTGASLGATTNTRPLGDADSPLAGLPSHTASAAQYALASTDTPDHYPLVTPQGTIPVADLAIHGRLRDEYRALEGYRSAPPVADYIPDPAPQPAIAMRGEPTAPQASAPLSRVSSGYSATAPRLPTMPESGVMTLPDPPRTSAPAITVERGDPRLVRVSVGTSTLGPSTPGALSVGDPSS